jgi:hypothetical protein
MWNGAHSPVRRWKAMPLHPRRPELLPTSDSSALNSQHSKNAGCSLGGAGVTDATGVGCVAVTTPL